VISAYFPVEVIGRKFKFADRLCQAITGARHDKTRLALMLSDVETVQNAAM
jgi:hypothetical protein